MTSCRIGFEYYVVRMEFDTICKNCKKIIRGGEECYLLRKDELCITLCSNCFEKLVEV